MNNKVEFIGYYGGDETHALSAWTSTYRELTEQKIERIPALLQMLNDDSHGTPFEKSMLHFLVTSDVASHIHILKHRIGVSVNAESARYKELKEDKFLIPEDWNGNKVLEKWAYILKEASIDNNSMYHDCLKDLTPILGRKRAKESARFFKMYNSQIVQDVSFNWRSFAHFQILRNSEHSQKEIRDIAQMMLELVKNIDGNPFEHTIKAFGF